MHHACVARFDVMENLENFCELNKASYCSCIALTTNMQQPSLSGLTFRYLFLRKLCGKLTIRSCFSALVSTLFICVRVNWDGKIVQSKKNTVSGNLQATFKICLLHGHCYIFLTRSTFGLLGWYYGPVHCYYSRITKACTCLHRLPVPDRKLRIIYVCFRAPVHTFAGICQLFIWQFISHFKNFEELSISNLTKIMW